MSNFKLCALLFVSFAVFATNAIRKEENDRVLQSQTLQVSTTPGASGRIVNDDADVYDLEGNVVDRIPLGSSVDIVCQFYGTYIDGYDIWNYVPYYRGVIWDGNWKADSGNTEIVVDLCPLV